VTPFEVPAGDTMPEYAGPDELEAVSVLIRRDYTIVEPERLFAQARRAGDGDDTVSATVNAAIGAIFGEYEPDEIAQRHKEFGLEEGDSTMWVSAVEPAEPGEWLDAPFEQADPQLLVCRFDVSAVFDDELSVLDPD